MMRMIDPLSELCGPCVELLGTSWSRSQQGHKEPNVWKPHFATWGGWEVSKGLHATCVYPPTSLPCQPPEEQDIFFSLTLIGVFVWKESTYQAWRRLRSRWSSTIIHRVLKLQNIVNSELLLSIKLCKLTVCLSIFLNCGTPLKIAKFISYIFFEKPCTVFNI